MFVDQLGSTPIDYARAVTATVRKMRENHQLGVGLTSVAGTTNAGAFLPVQQYTFHMTGIVSFMADAVILSQWRVRVTGHGVLHAFVRR